MTRAISLWEPWATLMALGEKKVETRSKPFRYVGWLVICAAKAWNEETKYYFELPEFQAALNKHGIYRKDQLGFGHALCKVWVEQSLPVEAIAAGMISKQEREFGNYALSQYRHAWFSKDVVRFEKPIPVIGRQFLFDIKLPDEAVQLALPEFG